jgi:hypothetical protein
MAPTTAGMIAYLCKCLGKAGVAPLSGATVALLIGLGTPIWFRAAHLNHNLLVCNAGFIALLLLWEAPPRFTRTAIAGALSGFALLCDYSGVVVIATAGAYALLRTKRENRASGAVAFCAGLAPMILALLIYQQWAFGSFYHPSQHFMTPTAPTAHGYRGIDWPSPALAWANFFDPRFGLLAYCPLLALSAAAPFVRGRVRVPPLETAVLFGYFVLFVLFCAANQYSWLQPSTGFRYLVPVVPGLALLAIQAVQAFPVWVKWVFASAALAQSAIMAAGHQSTFARNVQWLWRNNLELPWMFRMWDLGAPVTWMWVAATFSLLAAMLAIVWRPVLRGV